MRYPLLLPSTLLGLALACEPTTPATPSPDASPSAPLQCVAKDGATPDALDAIGCPVDFDKLASAPIDASIPGARSMKTVLDRLDSGRLHFQNSVKYAIHWEYCRAFLSGGGLPPVPTLSEFNATEYYSPDRRFLLGAVTYYEEPGIWAYEISPYDTASADMIATAFAAIQGAAYFGPELRFHPTSQAVATEAAKLPPSVPIVTTDELFAGISYQPLNLGVTQARVRFVKAADLETAGLHFRDVVVLDRVPNDISVVAGIVTAELQTPLSHINVLSQNRGTPNMALTNALTHEALRALEGKWVELKVGPFEWSVHEVTAAEAETWWQANKPPPLGVPKLDLSVTALTDYDKILDLERLSLGDAIDAAIPAFGGKASHFASFSTMNPAVVPHPKAFAIPVAWYWKLMEDNGLHAWVDQMLAEPQFIADPVVRTKKLAALRQAIMDAPPDPELESLLMAKLAADFPGQRMRFRSSTNAEDLDGFTGAGLYTSKAGDPDDPDQPMMAAVHEVWASIWRDKAFDERSYRSIEHRAVGMALLVHRSFPSELANGVALTANIFDTSGLEPGFYINVQAGGASVVLPEAGTKTDQLVYHFQMPGQPIVFLSHSNLIPTGSTVLTAAQTYELGKALAAIHQTFLPIYGPPPGTTKFYAMDVEFKFDAPANGAVELVIKQARPHPGWGL